MPFITCNEFWLTDIGEDETPEWGGEMSMGQNDSWCCSFLPETLQAWCLDLSVFYHAFPTNHPEFPPPYHPEFPPLLPPNVSTPASTFQGSHHQGQPHSYHSGSHQHPHPHPTIEGSHPYTHPHHPGFPLPYPSATTPDPRRNVSSSYSEWFVFFHCLVYDVDFHFI